VVQDTEQQAPSVTPSTPARVLLPSILPAVAVGVVSSLLLVGVEVASEELQGVLWETVPDALGIGRYSVAWMFVMLVATGVAVGLVVWKVPGHAGPDPATVGLDAPVLPPVVLPGLLLAAALMLAGGPSLGPENPIIAVNVGLAVWLGGRALPGRRAGSGRRWRRQRRSAPCSARPWGPPSSSPRYWPGRRRAACCGTTSSRR
jgi:H+/Cl- antiporter ClcA